VIAANGVKILTQGDLGDDVSQIREREAVAPSDFMPTFGDVFQPCPIYPGIGGCHHRKVDVIDYGMCIVGPAFAATNLLFDFLETGFYFPPRAIALDDLFNGQIQVSGKQDDPLCFTKNPDYTDRAFERFEHDHLCSSHHVAVMPIEKNAWVRTGILIVAGRKKLVDIKHDSLLGQ